MKSLTGSENFWTTNVGNDYPHPVRTMLVPFGTEAGRPLTTPKKSVMRIVWWGWMLSCLMAPVLPFSLFTPRFTHALETTPTGELVTIEQLLQTPGDYHHALIRIRGTVTRLELHLDETNHFVNFVFFLKTGNNRVLVFGRHDRTLGDIQLTTGRTVEVQGVFRQEREAQGHTLFNQIEAHRVTFYPPLTPDEASHRPQRQTPSLVSLRDETCPEPAEGLRSRGGDGGKGSGVLHHASARKLSGLTFACRNPRTS